MDYRQWGWGAAALVAGIIWLGYHSHAQTSTDRATQYVASEDVQMMGCHTDHYGFGTARVQIVNNGTTPASYIVTVAFESADGSVQYDTGLASADTLQPGQTAETTAQSTENVNAAATCRIVDVERL